MKVLVVLPDGDTMAGVQCRVLASLSDLKAQGFELGLMAGGNPNNVGQKFQEAGFPFCAHRHRLTPPGRFLPLLGWIMGFPFFSIGLWSRFRAWDVIHIHGFTSFPLVVLARLAGKKVIWHLIGNHAPRRLVAWSMPIFKWFPSKTILVAPSMASFYCLTEQEFELVWEPCWADEKAEMTRLDLQKELGFEGQQSLQKEIWLIGVGHLVPAKNWPLWVEVAACLPPHYRFFIFGKSVKNHEHIPFKLQEMVHAKGLGSRFHLSYDPDIRLKLHLFDGMLSTSRFEGTPLTLLEAQAQGLFVVAPKTGGIEDIVPKSSLVEGQNPEHFRQKIEAPADMRAFDHQRHSLQAYVQAMAAILRNL